MRKKNNITSMEILAKKMSLEVYPEILKYMIDFGDSSFSNNEEKIQNTFKYENGRMTISSWCANRHGSSTREISRGGVSKDLCPLFIAKVYSSSEYIMFCENVMSGLKILKQRKIRISKIIDSIDSLPIELKRNVIIEKIN